MKYILLVIFCTFLSGCAWKSELVSVRNALEVAQYNSSQSESELSRIKSQLSESESQLVSEQNRYNTCEAQLVEQEKTVQYLQSQPKEISYRDENGNVTGIIRELPQ